MNKHCCCYCLANLLLIQNNLLIYFYFYYLLFSNCSLFVLFLTNHSDGIKLNEKKIILVSFNIKIFDSI